MNADGAADVAWYYPDPLDDAVRVKDLLCFWQPATVTVDGVAVETAMPGD